ncbi:hypothetical protein MBVG596_1082 [Mycoplasmopsis bovigenitalium]|uniref:hypothetical protein n=1 Tax=Mycoplasmopsis bovigenitalium TaxID=2112 RepID=UPI00090B4BB2|nr:hypothetical protein [Mycoplasmopsis bovigenitalium]BAW18558.1 hypothetical protein MBVG596_1082 [Mycoplasmopsis bovigenitalium]
MSKKLELIPLDLWVYDIEVYPKFWCVSFYNVKTKEIKTFKIGEHLKLQRFIDEKLKGQFVGGFNNSNYDDHILKEILQGINPNGLNNWIVKHRNKPWEWPYNQKINHSFLSFDVLKLLGPGRLSLKKYEAFLGLAIKETQVPFDYDKELTPEQIEQVIEYNIYDVKATAFLFLKFIDQFIIRLKLVEDYNLPNAALHQTMTQITASIFNAHPSRLARYTEYYYEVPQNIKELYAKALPEYNWLISKLESTKFYSEYHPDFQKEQVNLQLNVNGLIYEFKSGGLHAAQQTIIENDALIYNSDIVSNYPNLIVKYNYGSRAAKNMEQTIAQLIEKRVQNKKQGNTLVSSYMKELIVRPFGAMGFKFSNLWDSKQRMSICLTGELIIFFLAVKLSNYAEILQVNTDGIMYQIKDVNNLPKIEKILNAWQKITMLDLETTQFAKLWQKDVNNYILVNKEGEIKTKGGMVKYHNKRFHHKDFDEVRGVANNNLTVLDKAVVNYFVYGIEPETTIKQEKDLVAFQFIFDVKGNYSAVFYGDNEVEKASVVRVFYTRQGQPVFKAQKIEGKWRKDKVPFSSERCTIVNDSVLNKQAQELDLDYEYYVLLAWSRINQYLNKTPKNAIETTKYPGVCFECGLCSASLLDEIAVREIYDGIEVCKKCYFNNTI